MQLTTKQEQGLKEILARYHNKEKYTTIAGFAGTGKSTLTSFAIQALGVDLRDVAYAAYTGKAAEVLRKKGNPGACTIHQLLYDHRPAENGGFIRMRKPSIDAKIVVIDEVSMVPQTMIDLLLSHPVYVIFLGDPFQLPPVGKDAGNELLAHPHVFLDEIMRQAAESEIIRLSMDIRNNKKISFSKGSEVIVMPQRELTTGCLDWADQVLVATNATRRSINDQMRAMGGFEGNPKDGEKMICLRNYWDIINNNENPLVNGSIGIIKNPVESITRLPNFVRNDEQEIEVIKTNFLPDNLDEEIYDVTIDKKFLYEGTSCLNWYASCQLNKSDRYKALVPQEFDFAYAITVHKSQGSEWDKVLVIEERFPFERIEHARWLYTAVTRASSRLVLTRP